MIWEMERFGRGDIRLSPHDGWTVEQHRAALRAVARFRESGHADAETTADRLKAALGEIEVSTGYSLDGEELGEVETAPSDIRIPWEVVVSLSRWCHTAGPYKSGRVSAVEVSRALFGEVLPNLGRNATGRRISSREAKIQASEFLERLARKDRDETFARNLEVTSPEVLPSRVKAGSAHCLSDFVQHRQRELKHRILSGSLSLDLAAVGIEWELARWEFTREEPAEGTFSAPVWLTSAEAWRHCPFEPPIWDLRGWVLERGADHKIFVRARSYPEERPTRCTETDPKRLAEIDRAFARTQGFLGSKPGPWRTPELYELGVDLTVLYYLNEIEKSLAWLALIYFVNDRTSRPTSLEAWRKHHRARMEALGLHPGCRLLDRIIPLFLDADPAGPLDTR